MEMAQYTEMVSICECFLPAARPRDSFSRNTYRRLPNIHAVFTPEETNQTKRTTRVMLVVILG